MKSYDRSLLLSILCLIFSTAIGGEIDVLAADAPIHIEANRMTSTEKSNAVVFTGDVDAKQGDVRIRSDEMTVFYNQLKAQPSNLRIRRKHSQRPKRKPHSKLKN